MPLILMTWEAKFRSQFEASLGKRFVRPSFQLKSWVVVVCTCHPNYGRKPKIGGSWSWAKSEALSPK
jgi:hypothetical protein